MKFWKLVSATIAIVLSTGVKASIIDFEGIAPPGGTATYNGLTLSTEGYDFQIHTGTVISSTYNLGGYNNHDTINGTDWLMLASDHPMVMTQLNGGAFSIQSMSFFSWHSSGEVTITGEYSGGGTIIENLLFTSSFENYNFSSDWVGLSSVTFIAPIANIALDNIVVVSSVPIPAAVWLFVSGLIGFIGFARRKKK